MGGKRRQRSVAVVGALAVITGVTGLAAAAFAGPGSSRPVLSPDASAAPSLTSTTTTTVDQPPPAPDAVAPTAAVSFVPASTSTTSTVPCRNSTDPACGPFRWDPDPGPNEPLTVSVTFSPEHPHPGEPVTFFVRAVDPDTKWFWGVSGDFGDPKSAVAIDGSSMVADAYPSYCAPAKYGPWTPPPRIPSSETLGDRQPGVVHVYAEPGTYTAHFSFRSDSTACGLHEPYGSYGSGSVTVVVEPAEPTTTTTPLGS